MAPVEFEREQHNFRGYNDKRVSLWQRNEVLVDAIDVGLYGQVTPDEGVSDISHNYSDNQQLWSDLLKGRIGHGDTVTLSNFHLLEWLPASPGRYFTPEATQAREQARDFWDWGNREFLPLGKYEMVLGGVGSVRLAPRTVHGGEVCFFGATSTGISHQGIPIIVPLDSSRRLLRELRTKGAVPVLLTGTLWPLPLERSPLDFDRKIPKYFVFAEHIDNSDYPRSNESLVTVAITYSAGSKGEDIPLEEIPVNGSKHWSFASFCPMNGFEALNGAVEWLKKYATRYPARYENGQLIHLPPQKPSILGDFDEVYTHFENPIEFPLESILRGKYDPRLLDFYGSLFKITIRKEIVMGDKFENIQNATIINRSFVQDAIKMTRENGRQDVADALTVIAGEVEKSQNAAAGSLLNSLTTEMKKPQPDKSILKQCWDGLTAVLPDVAKLTEAASKITSLFL